MLHAATKWLSDFDEGNFSMRLGATTLQELLSPVASYLNLLDIYGNLSLHHDSYVYWL